ncbi:MAG TPA: hypothetical protein VF241_01980 [Propionibacteriaceae bacterium]
MGANVKDVHNPGGGDGHSPLGAMCRTPMARRGLAPIAAARPSLADT